MTKKFWTRLGLGLGFLIIAGTIICYYFPHIWGDILYPLDYEAYIVKYSKEYDLEPTFVSAVIYSESGFDKDSISRMGARGLMQIMPATGRIISKKLNEDNFTVDKLLDPETNIRYGCWYLRYLWDNYNDQNAVLAAYNGGGRIGDRYVVAREAGIPKETANFIKTVNFAQSMYQKLYADRLDINISEENIASKMRIQERKEETWLERLLTAIKKSFQRE